MAEWFQARITRLTELTDLEQKKDVLTDIKIKLGSLNNREAGQLLETLNMTPMYTQLATNDKEFVKELCEVFKMLFKVLESGEVYKRHLEELCKLITHHDETVRSFVLHEILRTFSNPEKLSVVLCDINLFVDVINRIGDDNLHVANCAMNIIKKVGCNTAGLHILYKGELLRTFAHLLVENDTVSFRVYEVIIDVAKSSKEGLDASAESGFLHSLINILENENILLQLNALTALMPLAMTEEGLKYLEQQEVLERLARKINSNDTPLSNLLIPGLMKFFGNVARTWPNEIFSKYPAVVSALFEVIDNGDLTNLGAALETLEYVAESVEGKYALQALGDTMPCALRRVAEIIQKLPTELRIRGLNCLSSVLNVKRNEQDNRILSLTKSWFDCLCDDPLGMIVRLCRQPFADIRQASLDVLTVIASQEWGQEYISTYPGLIEFLLDRSVESFKKCKEVKFEIVKQLSMARQDIFTADVMQKFKQFVSEGPFFVEAITEVAMEGAT